MCLCHGHPVSILLNCRLELFPPLSMKSAAGNCVAILVGEIHNLVLVEASSNHVQWPLSMLVRESVLLCLA